MENLRQHQEAARDGGIPRPAEEVESDLRLGQEVERLREELSSERERSLRAVADFDNYRRRVRQERAASEHSGKKELLLALLEVADDFDRALPHVGVTDDAVADGLRLIYRRLRGVLRSKGVTPFDSVGRPFDPTVHEATSTIEGGDLESGTVYSEDRRGYLWNDELLRPARVVVAR
ncbi:MAG TPA: nucleotide exchange factor GrpE [Pyrinomonadaceae bacterium]|nr:nucleotide exchange factor GrpE [Pyrinomonadaceae bacterium]